MTMMTTQKILVLGGSGFVGAHLASALSKQGAKVVIPTRRKETSPLSMLPNVSVVHANINDPQVLASLMHKVDAVINLVGVLHDRSAHGKEMGARFTEAHVALPKKIVAAMQARGVSRLIQMSAIGASVSASSGYSRSKAAGEALVLEASNGLDVTVFRPSAIFGQDDLFINTLAKLVKLLPVVPLFNANVRFQPVYVGDVANAMIDSLSRRETFAQTYELGGAKTYSLLELTRYIATLLGKNPLVIDLPTTLAEPLAAIMAFLPHPPISPDNLKMMHVDNATDGWRNYPTWHPTPLEAIVPAYFGTLEPRLRHDDYRCPAGRA